MLLSKRLTRYVGFRQELVYYKTDGLRTGLASKWVKHERIKFKFRKIIRYQTAMGRRTI